MKGGLEVSARIMQKITSASVSLFLDTNSTEIKN